MTRPVVARAVRIPALLVALAGMPPLSQAATRQLPAGTAIPIRFETTVSSATSRPEDKVLATVRESVRSGGHVVIPAGSELRGHVLSAHHSGRVKGLASLSVAFNEVVIDGKPHRISARMGVVAHEQHKRDAAIIGGGAGAGAIIGAIKDGGSGAAKGGLIGAGAGTGVVLATKGKEVTLPSGTRWRVRLSRPLIVD